MDNRHNYLPSNKSPYSFCCSDSSGKCRQKSTSFSLPDSSTIEDQQVFCMAFREDTQSHKFTGETSDCEASRRHRLWGQINKSHPDPDELERDSCIISPDTFFTYGLVYSAYFPGADNRNLVRQFFDLLSSTNPHQLRHAIASFKSQHQPQFDLIKRICWQHLSAQRKQFIFSVFS